MSTKKEPIRRLVLLDITFFEMFIRYQLVYTKFETIK